MKFLLCQITAAIVEITSAYGTAGEAGVLVVKGINDGRLCCRTWSSLSLRKPKGIVMELKVRVA